MESTLDWLGAGSDPQDSMMSNSGDSQSCSVVIPAYNADRWIRHTVESALSQTYPLRQVVIVDDGSTDRTADFLSEFGGRILVVRQKNQGVASARNAGAALTDSTHLAFLDADDEWEPDKIALQMANFAAEPNLVMVQCGVMEIDADGHELSGRVLKGRSGHIYRDLVLQEPVVYGGGSGPVFARWVFDLVGGFDPRFSTSADWHLWLRVARHGPVGLVEKQLLRYRIHDSNMHANVDAERHDMLLGLQEAIAGDPTLSSVSAKALSRCHRTLAGGYWQHGRYGSSVAQMFAASIRDPSNVRYFIGKLWRRISRLRRH